MKRSAFTLVELLVVISIIGLLSSIAIVQMSGSKEKARIARGLAFEGQFSRALGNDLIGEWDLDDCSGTTAKDFSGFGNNGTLNAGATWSGNTVNGSGCSVSFNGANGSIALPYISTSSVALSYSMWFNSTSATSLSVFSFRSNLIRVSSTGIDWWPDVNIARTTVNVSISLNAWHHLVVDQNGTAYSMYLDGALISSGTAMAINNTNWGNAIGSYRNGTFFNGLIDNVRVFDHSLTSLEVWHLYAEEEPRHNVSSRFGDKRHIIST